MDGDIRGRIAKLRRVIEHKRRAKQNFDAEALELSVLLDEISQIRGGVKMTPTQKIMNIRG